jgi:cell fate regulator YaaT (PSP1 superfamily)
MVDSPGSLHSFPGIRDYPLNTDVQNYFNNDHDRRRIAEQQFQYYQMQNRFRQPMSYPSAHESQRSFQFHDPDQYTLHIVKFKANRMDVFYLSKEKKLDLQVKDYVIVDGDRGTDLGMVSKVNVTEAEARALTAQLQREQAAATAANQNGMNANAMEAIAAAANQVQERDVTIPKKFIHRLAVRGEIDGLQMKMQDEAQAKQVCEMKVQQRGLQMDILDVEYQWCAYPNDEMGLNGRDRRKLYIYFIAPQRVDFVALVKDLFKIYKTRIWLHNSTASHVTSQLTSQPSFMQPQNQQQQEGPDFSGGAPHPQHQFDYFRSPPHRSPGQGQYLPMQHGSMFSPQGGYYSPHSQQYFPPPPLARSYPPPHPPANPAPTPPHMPFTSSGPPPPGHW